MSPPPPDDVDLEFARRFAAGTARAAGEIIQRSARNGFTVSAKGSGGDVLTSLDLATESYIIGQIRAQYPGHRIHSEEAGLLDGASASASASASDGHGHGDGVGVGHGDVVGESGGGGGGAWLWLVDPLDGTNNLAVGLSMYVVGMTLCRAGVPVLGVIHDPVTDQTWTAVKDRGLDGVEGIDPLRRRRPPGRGLLVAWTQGYGVRASDPAPAALKFLLELNASRVLQLWTPLLSWAMLARGDIDAFVGYRAGLLDLSGGALIAAETGLVVTDLDGKPFRHRIAGTGATRDFVAGRPEVVERVLDLMGEVPRVESAFRELRA